MIIFQAITPWNYPFLMGIWKVHNVAYSLLGRNGRSVVLVVLVAVVLVVVVVVSGGSGMW